MLLAYHPLLSNWDTIHPTGHMLALAIHGVMKAKTAMDNKGLGGKHCATLGIHLNICEPRRAGKGVLLCL